MASLLQAMMSEAIEEFETKFANLIACFDATKLYRAMTSLAVLQDGGLPKQIVEALENGDSRPHLQYQAKILLTLLRRGALRDFQVITPLTAEADAESDQLEIVAGEKTAPAPPIDPKAAQAAAIDQCVADYKQASTREFRARWMGDAARRQVYEAAIAAGRI